MLVKHNHCLKLLLICLSFIYGSFAPTLVLGQCCNISDMSYRSRSPDGQSSATISIPINQQATISFFNFNCNKVEIPQDALPPGLVFNNDPISHTATISGTPTTSGTYEFTATGTGGEICLPYPVYVLGATCGYDRRGNYICEKCTNCPPTTKALKIVVQGPETPNSVTDLTATSAAQPVAAKRIPNFHIIQWKAAKRGPFATSFIVFSDKDLMQPIATVENDEGRVFQFSHAIVRGTLVPKRYYIVAVGVDGSYSKPRVAKVRGRLKDRVTHRCR